jgi:hypothetical protein
MKSQKRAEPKPAAPPARDPPRPPGRIANLGRWAHPSKRKGKA